MKDSNKRSIIELKSQNINTKCFREKIREILCDEIKAINAPNQKLLEVIDLLDYLQFPLKVSTHIIVPEKKADNKKELASVAGSAIMGIMLSRSLKKCSVIPSILLSLGASIITGVTIAHIGKAERLKQPVNVEQRVDSTTDEIVTNIDKIICLVSILIIEKKQLLDKNYSNIIKWYQQAYSDCDDFGEEFANFFKKRIESVLLESHYYLHNYNGENGNLFEKTETDGIENLKQDLPAITNENGYILAGHIFIPSNKK